MSGIDDRQDKFEKQFAHDQALQFKVEARRNKLLGLWAADLMGLEGEKADDYAKAVIRADLEEPGDEDVFRKLRADLDAARIGQSDQQIRTEMESLLVTAKEQIRNEG